MTEARIPPVSLLTTLLVEFCLSAIRGAPTGKAPVTGTELSPEMRRTVGIASPGRTIAYPAKDATVFLDLNEERAQVWFIHPDAHGALDTVQRALQAAAPGLVQIAEAHPMQNLAERVLLGDLGNGRGVRIEFSYPATRAENFFIVRTIGLRITDPKSFKTQLESSNKKGKS